MIYLQIFYHYCKNTLKWAILAIPLILFFAVFLAFFMFAFDALVWDIEPWINAVKMAYRVVFVFIVILNLLALLIHFSGIRNMAKRGYGVKTVWHLYTHYNIPFGRAVSDEQYNQMVNKALQKGK